MERCEGRGHDALIFLAKRRGKHWRDWVAEETERLCELAGVPAICAHSLGGFVATVAIRAVGISQLVSAELGHCSVTTTMTSYALRGSAQHAQQKRALDVLDNSAGSRAFNDLTSAAKRPATSAPN